MGMASRLDVVSHAGLVLCIDCGTYRQRHYRREVRHSRTGRRCQPDHHICHALYGRSHFERHLGEEVSSQMPEEADLRSRLNALEHLVTALIARITSLEAWQRQSEIADARTDEKWKNVDRRFDDLANQIKNVSGVLTRIMWIVVGGILAAAVTFIVSGGLKSL